MSLVCAEGKYQGYLYVFDFQSERPIHHIKTNKMNISYLHLDFKINIIFIGNS